MNVDLDAIPFVEARWYHVGRLRPPRLLVVHTPEFPELNDGAERLAQFFATTDRQASVHVTVDSDSMVRSVQDTDTAFGAENANADGLHCELVGYAGQGPEEWDDDYSNAVLERAGALFRAWADRFGIPKVRLSVPEIAAGQAGICSHADVYQALGGSAYRWDPGPAFPWDEFMAHVTGARRKETRMLPQLLQRPAGMAEDWKVYVYDPNTHTVTWLRTPEALAAVQNSWRYLASLGLPAGNPDVVRNAWSATILADARDRDALAGPAAGGLTVAQVRSTVREELNKTRLTG